MAGKKFIRKPNVEDRTKQVLVTDLYCDNLEGLLNYTLERFGETVANKFIFELKAKINQLSKLYNIHPKCRFYRKYGNKNIS